MNRNDLLPIGELARRTGLAVSAIRFYEDKGLIQAFRTMGNQRRFLRSDIRRLSFILIAQKLGLGLAEIESDCTALRRPPLLHFSGCQPISITTGRRTSSAASSQMKALKASRLPGVPGFQGAFMAYFPPFWVDSDFRPFSLEGGASR